LIAYAYSSFSTVDICASSVLSGVTKISGSKNTIYPINNLLISYDIVSTVNGGSITFPTAASLTTLYGVYWSQAYCEGLSIIRLS